VCLLLVKVPLVRTGAVVVRVRHAGLARFVIRATGRAFVLAGLVQVRLFLRAIVHVIVLVGLVRGLLLGLVRPTDHSRKHYANWVSLALYSWHNCSIQAMPAGAF
jgi:hypothetical protein